MFGPTAGSPPATGNSLEFYNACWCAGTGCGGHVKIQALGLDIGWHPIGWQGAAQHTYTRSCDGFHAPGPCPEREPIETLAL